jgi:hypothetical protein
MCSLELEPRALDMLCWVADGHCRRPSSVKLQAFDQHLMLSMDGHNSLIHDQVMLHCATVRDQSHHANSRGGSPCAQNLNTQTYLSHSVGQMPNVPASLLQLP